MYRSVGAALPEIVPSPTTVLAVCPQCSRLEAGTCVICQPNEKHPSCTGCVDGQPPASPWWQSQIATTVGALVVASVLTAVVMSKFGRHLT